MPNQMIALQARGVQLPDYGGIAARYANVMASKMAMDKAQEESRIRNSLRDLAQSGVDFTTPEGQAQYIKAGGSVDEARKFAELGMARGKETRENFGFKNKALSTAVLSALHNPDDDNVRRALSSLQGVLPDEDLLQTEQALLSVPVEQRHNVLTNIAVRDPDVRQAIEFTAPKVTERSDGQNRWLEDTNPNSLTFGERFSHDQLRASPDAILNATTSAANRNLQEREVQYLETEGGVVPLPKHMGGGGIPGSRGGVPEAAFGQYGRRIEQEVEAVAPGARVTSGYRTPEHNAAVRGVRGSFHQTDNGRDYIPPKGESMNAFGNRLAANLRPKGYDVVLEGNHVHVEPGPRMARAPSGGGIEMGKPIPGTAKPAKGMLPAESKEIRARAIRDLSNLIEEGKKQGHILSNDQSWASQRYQEMVQGSTDPRTHERGIRTALPGGTAQKTTWDKIDKAIAAYMRAGIAPGTSGTLRALGEQLIAMRAAGGGNNPSYETLRHVIDGLAEEAGVDLKKPATGTSKASADIGKPPPGVTATEWQYMTPKERSRWTR